MLGLGLPGRTGQGEGTGGTASDRSGEADVDRGLHGDVEVAAQIKDGLGAERYN